MTLRGSVLLLQAMPCSPRWNFHVALFNQSALACFQRLPLRHIRQQVDWMHTYNDVPALKEVMIYVCVFSCSHSNPFFFCKSITCCQRNAFSTALTVVFPLYHQILPPCIISTNSILVNYQPSKQENTELPLLGFQQFPKTGQQNTPTKHLPGLWITGGEDEQHRFNDCWVLHGCQWNPKGSTTVGSNVSRWKTETTLGRVPVDEGCWEGFG